MPGPDTEAVGTPAPHWLEFVATGVAGTGFTVTDTVPVLEQVVAGFTAVTVYVCVTGAAVVLVGATVTELPVSGPGFQVHVYVPGPYGE